MPDTPEHHQPRGRIVADLPPRTRAVAEGLFDAEAIAPSGRSASGNPLFSARLVRAAVCVAVHGKFIPSFIFA